MSVHPADIELQSLADVQTMAQESRDATTALLELVRQHNQPAVPITVALTQARPIWHDEVRDTALSIGIINPSAFALRLGFAGGAATAAARGFPVPPSGAMVLPVYVEDLDVGLDDPAAVGSLTVVVFVLRFPTVQAFQLHRYG